MVQMRKVVRELYPEQFANGRQPVEFRRRRFFRRFADRRLKRVRARLGAIKKKWLVQAMIIALLVVVAWAHIYYYNKFLQLEADVHAARSQINVQLQRRKDVVASLNTVVVAYAKHEKEIFEHAIDTRNEMVRPAPEGAAKEAQNSGPRLPIPGSILDPALSRILAVAEGFPGLRLSENFQRLMDALVEVETQIAEKRMLLNSRCNDMTTALNLFPAFLFNKTLRFEVPVFYTADEDVNKPAELELTPP